MPIEFAYAQARVQARHGERLSPAAWQLLESTGGVGQYLHAARGTALAARVQALSPTSSAHAIERALRREWRSDVELAAHWVPGPWRPAVTWTAWLVDLPTIAWLERDGEISGWMRDDPVLSRLAVTDAAARHRAFAAAGLEALAGADDVADAWLGRFRALWPEKPAAASELRSWIGLVAEHRAQAPAADGDAGAARAARERLETKTVRMIRGNLQAPVTIFCHLLLVALDLGRLRSGLVRRALREPVPAGG